MFKNLSAKIFATLLLTFYALTPDVHSVTSQELWKLSWLISLEGNKFKDMINNNNMSDDEDPEIVDNENLINAGNKLIEYWKDADIRKEHQSKILQGLLYYVQAQNNVIIAALENDCCNGTNEDTHLTSSEALDIIWENEETRIQFLDDLLNFYFNLFDYELNFHGGDYSDNSEVSLNFLCSIAGQHPSHNQKITDWIFKILNGYYGAHISMANELWRCNYLISTHLNNVVTYTLEAINENFSDNNEKEDVQLFEKIWLHKDRLTYKLKNKTIEQITNFYKETEDEDIKSKCNKILADYMVELLKPHDTISKLST